jgi:hypothetical protein
MGSPAGLGQVFGRQLNSAMLSGLRGLAERAPAIGCGAQTRSRGIINHCRGQFLGSVGMFQALKG